MILDRQSISHQIQEFIADGDRLPPIADDINLFDNGKFDSVKVVNLVLFIEDTFAITLGFDDLVEENLSTIGAIVGLIENRQAEGPKS